MVAGCKGYAVGGCIRFVLVEIKANSAQLKLELGLSMEKRRV
jgi:hypothetical protein